MTSSFLLTLEELDSQTIFFDSATFKDAHFIDVLFEGDVCFQEARFAKSAIFNGTSFRHTAAFAAPAFDGYADFRRVTFGGDVSFRGYSDTNGNPKGHFAVFRGPTMFREGKFQGRAIFTNRVFQDSTDFRNAVFKVAPEFHNCTLHQDTLFSGAEFYDVEGTDDVDAAHAYRVLKLAMEAVRARHEEARFYSYEQQSLRAWKDTGRLVKTFSWLYEASANYGQSIALPIFWLLFVFFIFALFYAFLGGPAMWGEESVWRFALRQVFYPFGTFRVSAEEVNQLPLWLALLAAFQSVLTLAMLALFFLGLRRRFKLD